MEQATRVTDVCPLEPGDPLWIGPFRVLGVLGASGCGAVYLGQGRDGRQAAVKLLRFELVGAPGFRAQLERELWAASHVRDAHVAHVIDGDLDAARPWVASRYVPGPSLAGRVVERGALPLDEVLHFASTCAEALAAIHECHLVHGDVKPASVILGADGPTLIDIGISNALAAASLSRTGVFADSLAWSAPEQAAGGLDTSSGDVFAWGLLVAYAATGRHPYGEGSPAEIADRIRRWEPDLSGLPGQLRAPVAAALHRDPAQRPDAAALQLRLPGQAAAAPDDGPAAATDPWPPRGARRVRRGCAWRRRCKSSQRR